MKRKHSIKCASVRSPSQGVLPLMSRHHQMKADEIEKHPLSVIVWFNYFKFRSRFIEKPRPYQAISKQLFFRLANLVRREISNSKRIKQGRKIIAFCVEGELNVTSIFRKSLSLPTKLEYFGRSLFLSYYQLIGIVYFKHLSHHFQTLKKRVCLQKNTVKGPNYSMYKY